jgi:predicted dinucleotide-binding enzyme
VANSRGPHTLADLARESGAHAATVEQAANHGEVVIVSIPEGRIPALSSHLFEGLPAHVTVVDTGNYYPHRDGRIDEIENGMPESQWVAKQLGRAVVKGFNNIRAHHLMALGCPPGAPGRIALPVAGDDWHGKSVVMQLMQELGFDAVDAGPLTESWRQQPGTPVYTTDLDADGLRRALQQASRERPNSFRAA